jgi:hypothetical protein
MPISRAADQSWQHANQRHWQCWEERKITRRTKMRKVTFGRYRWMSAHSASPSFQLNEKSRMRTPVYPSVCKANERK